MFLAGRPSDHENGSPIKERLAASFVQSKSSDCLLQLPRPRPLFLHPTNIHQTLACSLSQCSSTSYQRPRRGSCFAQLLKQMAPFAHRLPHSTLLIDYNNDEDMPLQLVQNDSIAYQRPQLTSSQRRRILSSSVVVSQVTSPPSRPVKLVSRYNKLIALHLARRTPSDSFPSTGCLHRKAWLPRRHMSERRLHSFKVPAQQLAPLPPNPSRHKEPRY